MQLSLMPMAKNPNDVVYTPDDIARDIVDHFKPSGVCLDPCYGEGAFYRHLPSGSEWCEIAKGRDFFAWDRRVDWIVSNPPFSDYYNFLVHSFDIADNIVYLFPFHKLFQSWRNLELIYGYGGIKEIYVIGKGTLLNWGLGFAVGAVYFKRGYSGSIKVSFRNAHLTSISSRITTAAVNQPTTANGAGS